MAYDSKKNNMFNSGNLEVKWANIAEADEYAGSRNHQIVVWLDGPDGEAFAAQLRELAGPDAHINGQSIQRDTNRPFAKFKSTVFTKDGPDQSDRFGRVYGPDGKPTELNPYAGDTVKLRLSGPAAARNRPDAVSFYLNAVQIVSKKEREDAGGPFGEVEGYEAPAEAPAAAPVADSIDSGDIPF
jgi:hypothetical protein